MFRIYFGRERLLAERTIWGRYAGTIALLVLVGLAYAPDWASAEELLSEDYVLGPEDVVQVSVWGNPELGVTVPVRPDGKISLPLGNEIMAAGKTPIELRDAIATELKRYVKDPTVAVVVTQINSPRIYLIGSHPAVGPRVLKSATTMLQLISSLGPTTGVDLSRVQLIRDGKRMNLDLRKLVETALPDQDIQLKRGDIINIPNAFGRRVTVLGEVGKPSNIDYRDGMTIVDALLDAGWVTEFANLKRVIVVREEKGENQTIHVNVSDIEKGENVEGNVRLKPGDLVVVKERIF